MKESIQVRHPPWGAPCAGVVLGQARSILCSPPTIRSVLVTPAFLLLFSDAHIPAGLSPSPGTHLFCISSLIFIMKWPLLALKY